MNGIKPCGLWLSEGSSWRRWSIYSDMSQHVEFCHIVKVDMKNTLTISTFKDILEFEKKYKLEEDNFSFITSFEWNLIDWKKVKEDFSGIYITDYAFANSSLKVMRPWCSTWDVNSMCLWNLDNVIDFRPCLKKGEIL